MWLFLTNFAVFFLELFGCNGFSSCMGLVTAELLFPPASMPSPKDEPLKVGERVLWNNCPAHCASWNPFTISNIIGGQAWLDVYEKPVPLSELKRAP